jgi:hypothetical protein
MRDAAPGTDKISIHSYKTIQGKLLEPHLLLGSEFSANKSRIAITHPEGVDTTKCQ